MSTLSGHGFILAGTDWCAVQLLRLICSFLLGAVLLTFANNMIFQ
jgi:hypothetical protein